jgi:hypothetical protein
MQLATIEAPADRVTAIETALRTPRGWPRYRNVTPRRADMQTKSF